MYCQNIYSVNSAQEGIKKKCFSIFLRRKLMLENFLNYVFLNNTISEYLICSTVIIGGIIIATILRFIFFKKLKDALAKNEMEIDDILINASETPVTILLYYLTVYLSLHLLDLPQQVFKGLKIFGGFLVVILIVKFVNALLNYGVEAYLEKKEKDASRKQGMKTILGILKIIIWVIAGAIFLDNLGFKISTLLAGLGIGGIAVALGAQAILGDLFNFFAIFFDKPFEIGDVITIGDFTGTVEHTGIKTTRLRSVNGEQVIFSNTDLTNSRIRNYKRMERRRVVLKLGVTYETSIEHLKNIPEIIKNIIKNEKQVTFDRAHFASYGDFSLNFEIVYFVENSDYNVYMDIQQKINLDIKEIFDKHKIEFAYPTQKLIINN
jgi:small-conductance mechanosensitive channel